MPVTETRAVDVPAPRSAVWSFIADPQNRAEAISAVTSYERVGEGHSRWHVELPIPLISATIPVDAYEQVRDGPRYVEFVADSTVMEVSGTHHLEETARGTRLTNTFDVDGKAPGVESYFSHQLESELANLEAALERDLGVRL